MEYALAACITCLWQGVSMHIGGRSYCKLITSSYLTLTIVVSYLWMTMALLEGLIDDYVLWMLVTVTENRQLSMMTKEKENRRMSTGLGHPVLMWHFGFCWQLGCVQHSGATYRTVMKHITIGSRYVQLTPTFNAVLRSGAHRYFITYGQIVAW